MRNAANRLREWLEETHSVGFELRRHFFLRFFDSEFVSTPDQWRVVVAGAVGGLFSLSFVFTKTYYHKYLELNNLSDAGPFRTALLADVLFVITLAMVMIGLFATFEWPALFPGLRDYMALAALPIRMRELFVAKFTALFAVTSLATVATTLLPSLVLPAVAFGRYSGAIGIQVPAIFISTSLASLFVFFSLVSLQGVLLNVLPIRQFPRVSLAIQGILLSVLVCSITLVISIPSMQGWMDLRPSWAGWVPPVWFLGLDQFIVGNREPF